MLKRIKYIKNFGVYHNFEWNTVNGLKDKSFSKLNIIYGRNYSGKTTLSRLIRCVQQKKHHEDFIGGSFGFDFDGHELTESELEQSNLSIRVFNKDFVKDNLEMLLTDQGEVKPFALLGDMNIEVEKRIKELDKIIGDIDSNAGKKFEVSLLEESMNEMKRSYKKANDDLDGMLRSKASGMKKNPLYANVNYRINDIKRDIKVIKESFTALSEKGVEDTKKVAEQKKKIDQADMLVYQGSLQSAFNDVIKLLSKQIAQTIPIQELIDDKLLQKWVKDGISLNRERQECGFCGSPIDSKLWEKLQNHFNKESEEYLDALNRSKRKLQKEVLSLQSIAIPLDKSIYSELQDEFNSRVKEFENNKEIVIKDYQDLLESVSKRENDPFEAVEFELSSLEVLDSFDTNIKNINEIIKKNIDYAEKVDEKKKNAINMLRRNEVYQYLKDIDYENRLKDICDKKKSANNKEQEYKTASQELLAFQEEKRSKEASIQDESKGAEKINEYLANYFGHNSLRLEHVEEDNKSRFVIKRGDHEARNLSEGECSLIAFCYFMAKLHEVDTERENLIIWIDDPISSLDSNHIFFIFSLIESEIGRPFETGQGNSYKYEQLFISTHNLEFLKYLKRLTPPFIKNGKDKVILVEHFLVERVENESKIKHMPKHIKNYATEFNYLFHQIKRCAEENPDDKNYETFYSFGNNLRRFLESYLYYKYPNGSDINLKVKKFFGEGVQDTLVLRIANEMSHAEGTIDRSQRPIDISEAHTVAKFVLETIEQKDKDQYDALIKSIRC